MSSRLERLPTELRDAILTNLVPQQDDTSQDIKEAYTALFNLCVTSKRLREAATPFLYNTYISRGEGDSLSFGETIIRNEEKANQVRQVVVAAELFQLREDDRTLSSEELDLLCDAVKEKMSDRNDFYRFAGALANGCQAVQQIPLLSATTQIRTLHFVTGRPEPPVHMCCFLCYDVYRWLGSLFADAKVRGQYDKLEEVFIHSDDYKLHASYYHMLPLLHLPALKRFSAYGLRSDDFDGSAALAWTKPTPSSTLRDIELLGADLNQAAICEIISCATTLKRFTLQLAIDHSKLYDDDGEAYVDIDPPELLASLRQHKSLLEEVTIDNLQQEGEYLSGEEAIGSFVDFTALKSISIEADLLLGRAQWSTTDLSRVLSKCLEKLTIHTHNSLQPTLSEICAAMANFQAENLKDFHITFSMHACEYLLAEIDSTPNVKDVATFSRLPGDERMEFRCWAEDIPRVLGEFANLIDRDEAALEYMFDWQAALSLEEDGSVAVRHSEWDIQEDLAPNHDEEDPGRDAGWIEDE